MRTTIFLYLFFILLSSSGPAIAQTPTFTFECICDYVTGDTCDVCDDETLQSRLFKGLAVYRNGTMYRLIDAPYVVLFRDSTAIIQELTYPNPEKITIGIEGTNFTTITQYQDSLKCPCAGEFTPYIAGPGINIFNDTIASIPQYIDTFDIVSGAQDTLRISLSRDSVPYLYVILPGGGGGQSWTIDADAGDTELISNQTVLFAGGGINATNYDAGTNTLTITGTEVDGDATNEAWTIDGDAGDTELITTQTVLFEGTGIVNTTYTSGTNTLTINATESDGDPVNEAWTIDGDDADTELITTQTVKFEGGGINVTDYNPGTNTLLITGTELDGDPANEAWTIDAETGDTEVISTQTVLFDGTGIVSTDYNAAANTLTINATEADGDPNNELQTLSNAGTATTHTATLSDGGGSLQLAEGTGIGLATSGTTLDGIVTITNTGDLSATNEAWTVDADDADTELITTQTVKFEGAGIITTDYDPTLDKVVITGTEADGDATNEAWTIDADAGDTEVISTQTVLFDGTGIVNTTYTSGTNTLTINATESDGDPNNEIQVLSGSGTAPNYDINLSTGGGTIGIIQGTNMTITRSGNDFTFASSGGSGLTAAENGLSVSGTTVRLGGTLLDAATSLDGNGGKELRLFDGKFSFSTWTGFANTPVQGMRIQGEEALPTTASTPTQDGVVEFRGHSSTGSDQSNSLTVGIYPTNNDGVWMQARSYAVPNFEYPLSLQPRGGQLSVGRTGGLDALVTFAGIGVAGTGIAGSILHLENSEGNGEARLSFGGGTDFLDAAISWFDATDALRQNNYSTTNGTSSHRWSFGTNPESGDVMMLVKSAATAGARLAIGETSTANVYSTFQNKQGSIAPGRGLETVGSFTLDETNYRVTYTASSTVTWTLPDPSTCPDRHYVLFNRGGSGTVNIGGYTVSKGAGGNFSSLSAGQMAFIWSTGSGWEGIKITSE